MESSGTLMSWRWLTRNFVWKLVSLALSAVLWFAIVGEPELVTTHAAPILYRNLPKDLLIGSDALDAVRVELRGPTGRLTSATLSDLAILLDLSNASGPGERTFTLADADLHLPEGVAFVRAIPSQLRVRFARRKSKEVPVELRFTSAPPSGYAVVREEVTPRTIRIAGPEARIDAMESAQTDAIDLSGVTATREFHVNTFVADPQLWLESSPVVQVRLTIERRGN
jgi:YbbR domain-containing protein